jgi:hypothetical protein
MYRDAQTPSPDALSFTVSLVRKLNHADQASANTDTWLQAADAY